jgi:hypothetical protein
VENKAATGYGFSPSGVSGEIGCDEGESILAGRASNVQHGPDIGFTLQGTNGGAHTVACAEKLVNTMGAHKPGAASDEYEIFVHKNEHTRQTERSFCFILL